MVRWRDAAGLTACPRSSSSMYCTRSGSGTLFHRSISCCAKCTIASRCCAWTERNLANSGSARRLASLTSSGCIARIHASATGLMTGLVASQLSAFGIARTIPRMPVAPAKEAPSCCLNRSAFAISCESCRYSGSVFASLPSAFSSASRWLRRLNAASSFCQSSSRAGGGLCVRDGPAGTAARQRAHDLLHHVRVRHVHHLLDRLLLLRRHLRVIGGEFLDPLDRVEA